MSCKIDGCDRAVIARGWCQMHYRRWLKHGDPLKTLYVRGRTGCEVTGCERNHHSSGYCLRHYRKFKRYGNPHVSGHYRRRRGSEPTTSARWTRENLAWAAGLFEGEGSVIRRKNTVLRLSVHMTDREPLERLLEIFGGSINGPYRPDRDDRKPYWYWRLGHSPDAYAAMIALWPWLAPRRRRQVEAAMRHFGRRAIRKNSPTP